MGAVAVVLGEVHRPQQQAAFQRPEGPIHRREPVHPAGSRGPIDSHAPIYLSTVQKKEPINPVQWNCGEND